MSLVFFLLFLFYFSVHGISTENEIKISEDENKKGGKVTSTTVFVRNTKLMNPIFWKCEVVRRAKCNLYILLLNVYRVILRYFVYIVYIPIYFLCYYNNRTVDVELENTVK